MSILTQLRQAEKDRTRFKEIGTKATKSYQELQPKYSQAVQAARDYQGTVTSNYRAYQKAYNEGVGAFNTELKRLKGVYDSAVAKAAPLKSARDAAAQQANKLYSSYSSAYESGVTQGQSSYQTALTNLKSGADTASGEYERYLGLSNQEARKYNNMLDSVYLSPKTYTGGYQYDVGGIGGNIYAGDSRVTISRLLGSQELEELVPESKTSEDVRRKYRYDNYSNLYSSRASRSEASRAFIHRGEARTYQDSVYDLYTRGKRTYEDYQSAVAEAQRLSNLAAQTRTQSETYSKDAQKFLGIYQTEMGKYNKLAADTEYVTRYAQQQSTAALNAYNQYVSNTYNPAVARYNQASSNVQAAARAYNTYSADRSKVDAAASAAKNVYDSSLERYRELQAGYQQLEQPLNQYATEMKDASEQIQQLNLQIPGLLRSLEVEQDPRKRETRIGYGRSLMTSGTKRRSSAR